MAGVSEVEELQHRLWQAINVMELCTKELREEWGLGDIIMSCQPPQALMETVAELVGKRYENDLSGFYEP